MAKHIHVHLTKDIRTPAELRSEQSEDRARLKAKFQSLNDEIDAYNSRTRRRIDQALALGSNAESSPYWFVEKVRFS